MIENYQNDIKIGVHFKLNGTTYDIPSHDFCLRFRTTANNTYYDCWKKDGDYHNCAVDDDDDQLLICHMDGTGFSPGSLRVEFFDFIPDSHFDDGNQLKVVPSVLGTELTVTAGDGNPFMAEVALEIASILGDFQDDLEEFADDLDDVRGEVIKSAVIYPDEVRYGRYLVNGGKIAYYSKNLPSNTNFRLELFKVDDLIREGDTLSAVIANNGNGSYIGGVWFTADTVADDFDEATAEYQDVSNTYVGTTLNLGTGNASNGTHSITVPTGAKWIVFTLTANGTLTLTNPNTHTSALYNKRFKNIENKIENYLQLPASYSPSDVYNDSYEGAHGYYWHVGGGREGQFPLVMQQGRSYKIPAVFSASGNTFNALPAIAVYAGEQYEIHTAGSSTNARAWALTDTDYKLYQISGTNYNDSSSAYYISDESYRSEVARNDYTVTPMVIKVKKDGYLLVSNVGSLPSLLTRRITTFASVEEVYLKHESDAKFALKKEYKILAAGNSYTIDALTYLPQIMAVHHPEVSLKLTILYYSAASLKTYKDSYSSSSFQPLTYANGSWSTGSNTSLQSMLAQKWDLITFQQGSTLSDNYESRMDGVTDCLQFLINKCKNTENVNGLVAHTGLFGWLMTPAYPATHAASTAGNKQDAMMNGITDFAENVMKNYSDMGVLLPCGMALHNARKAEPLATYSASNNEFFYDDNNTDRNTHLRQGIGNYIESYAAMLALFGAGCPVAHTFGSSDLSFPYYYHGTSAGMTAANEYAARKCAMDAIENPFKKWNT